MNILRIVVGNPDELRNTAAYGSGAKVVVQRSATGGGTGFSEIGTVALDDLTNVYTYYDTAGTTTDWYRTRYSNTSGTVLSEWSDEFQTTIETPIGLEELRTLLGTDVDDEILQRLLDAAVEEVDAFLGGTGTVTEKIDGGFERLTLRTRAATIDSVTETRNLEVTTLTDDDYRIRADGYVLERLNTGTNTRTRWWGMVTVTYTPVSMINLRQQAIVDLVRLGIHEEGATGGASSERIGEYSYSNPTQTQATADRRAILSRLRPDPGIFVVGGPNPSRTW